MKIWICWWRKEHKWDLYQLFAFDIKLCKRCGISGLVR